MTVTESLEAVKAVTEQGAEYWRARDLMPILGYAKWSTFEGAIERAIASFNAAGEDAAYHFAETGKMIEIGKGGERDVKDYFLSRAACYLIAMNGDTTKPEIAEAQQYYAVQARRMEKLDRFIADQRRVDLRNRVKDRNTKLNNTAQEAGVTRFALFHGAGISAMYKMRLVDLKAKRGIGAKEDWLDRQGVEELAANEFRITQTDAKIRRENISGEQRAIDAHVAVAKEVRAAIVRVGNTTPENLPVEPPIREIEKRLKPIQKIGQEPA
jgi:DNA-damage-inducible protein D